MRIYHLNFLVHDKLDYIAEQLFRATALVRAECPIESLFFLRSHLLDTKWESNGEEDIVIAPTSILEAELQESQLKHWRSALDPMLNFKMENLSIDIEGLALSA